MKKNYFFNSQVPFIILTLIFSGCANLSQQRKTDFGKIDKFDEQAPTLVSQNIDSQLEQIPTKKIYINNKKSEFKYYKNKSVKKWINYFINKDRDRFERFLSKGSYYKDLMQEVLEDEGLPRILFYLPLIESGYNIKAYSSARAVGPWQFIRGTARRYKLTVNSVVDERRDPILSSEAAAKYLHDLFNVFNSWELAIAAYNCGEIRVLRAIMKGKSRNFWKLSEKKLLPRETREYVPKFMAAAYLAENVERYSIMFDTLESFPNVKATEVPGGITLYQLAKKANINHDELKTVNPSFIKGRIPTSTNIWVYPNHIEKITKVLPELQKMSKRKINKMGKGTYRIKKGDTLAGIAKRYKISIKRLKKINNLKNNRIIAGASLNLTAKNYKTSKKRKYYLIKKNDSLGMIARKFGVSVKYLKMLNGIHQNSIYVGQKINITSGVRQFRYTVKSGDNLFKIARLYNTTIKKIKSKNSLRKSTIVIGQVLLI